MVNRFRSNIEYGTMTINTNVDMPNIAFGETLSGTVYIEGEECETLIDYLEVELIKKSLDDILTVAKHSIEMMSDMKSKETWMIPFEIVPDERWETHHTALLLLRTTVYLKNGVDIHEEDEITYA